MLWNVYREFYDIPKDLYVRKADPIMRHAVYTSEAIRRAENLRLSSLNPALIFFAKNLEEY